MTHTSLRIAAIGASLCLSALATPVLAQSCTGDHAPGNVKLEAEATGLRNAQGEVAITVYAYDKDRFLAKGGKLLRVRVPAVAPVTKACFWLPPAKYEIAQYHDENGDHSFNRTLFVPKEGFGFSNDVTTALGRPAMEDAAFTLGREGKTIRIAMRYKR